MIKGDLQEIEGGTIKKKKGLEEVTLNNTASRLGGRSRGTVTRAGHSHACTKDIPSCIADAFTVGTTTQEKSLAMKWTSWLVETPP